MRQDRLDDGIIVGDRQAGLGPRSTEWTGRDARYVISRTARIISRAYGLGRLRSVSWGVRPFSFGTAGIDS
jgi:hypothetical protein